MGLLFLSYKLDGTLALWYSLSKFSACILEFVVYLVIIQ